MPTPPLVPPRQLVDRRSSGPTAVDVDVGVGVSVEQTVRRRASCTEATVERPDVYWAAHVEKRLRGKLARSFADVCG